MGGKPLPQDRGAMLIPAPHLRIVARGCTENPKRAQVDPDRGRQNVPSPALRPEDLPAKSASDPPYRHPLIHGCNGNVATQSAVACCDREEQLAFSRSERKHASLFPNRTGEELKDDPHSEASVHRSRLQTRYARPQARGRMRRKAYRFHVIAYDDSRRAERYPVVLLHGLPFDRTTWNRVVPLIGGAARLLTCDLRGHGESNALPPPYDISTHAQDVLAVLDEARITAAIIVGHSFGGYVALEVLRIAPKRVGGLGLIGASVAADTPEQFAARIFQADSFERPEERMPLLDAWLPLAFGADYVEAVPGLREDAKRIVERVPVPAVAAMLRAIARRADARALIQDAHCPVRALAGENDALIAYDELRAALGERLTIAPGTGHMIPIERPAAVAQMVSDLLRERSVQ